MNKDTAITLRGVTKRFGSFVAVDNLSIEVKQGTIHGFLGPNGAGKSTTIRMIMDFIRPNKGELSVFGVRIGRSMPASIKKRVGYLAGDMELYDDLTATQYLQYIAHLRNSKRASSYSRLCEELEVVMNKKIGSLSRGNKQKVGLVAALMDDPDLLILDEPTTGLDPLMQQRLYKILQEYVRRGNTVFMSSHVLGEVQEVCDVVTFMRQGRVIETVDVKRLLAQTRRRITLHAEDNNDAVLLDPPSTLNVNHVKRTKKTLVFDVGLADRKVMRWIATQPVKDVTITESNLDAIFMELYEEGQERV